MPPPDVDDHSGGAAAPPFAALVQSRLTSMSLHSLLEVSPCPTQGIENHCKTQNIRYQHSLPHDCSDLTARFDLALVHQIEALPLKELRACIGLLRNLLSERVWVLVEQEYCSNEEWISLGFKRDSIPGAGTCSIASFSYNLETYNHKRDWNNTRFWANPENWDKRF